jgi:predicted nucleic acid-binding protein
MRNGPTAFFVDTNVLVYAYDPEEGDKRSQAMRVLARLGTTRRGSISAQVLGEFFVTVTRKITPPLSVEEAAQRITNYVRSWVVYDLTEAVVAEAVRSVGQHQFPYWDGLIWATAKLNGVANVLSEDFSDGQLIEGVRFLNPFAETFDMSVIAPSPSP